MIIVRTQFSLYGRAGRSETLLFAKSKVSDRPARPCRLNIVLTITMYGPSAIYRYRMNLLGI